MGIEEGGGRGNNIRIEVGKGGVLGFEVESGGDGGISGI